MAHFQEEADEHLATHDDVKSVLGDINAAKMLAIMALRPTIVDVEQAMAWLSGDTDVFGPGEPLGGTASRIVTLLTEEEEEEPR